MPQQVTVEIDVRFPPAVVWRALTDADSLGAWLMPVTGFEPVVGQRFQLRAKPMPGWDGVIDAEVLELDEPHRMVWSWQGSQMRRGTTVTWTLEPLPSGGTRVRIAHAGFEGFGGLILSAMHGSGWKRFVRTNLPAHLERVTR
jgi:uncharacterized protein YndB with AHSA1/START domain